MRIGDKTRQLGDELREAALEVKGKIEAKGLELQGRLQDEIFDGRIGNGLGGDHSNFTDGVVARLGLSAFKDAPPPPVLPIPAVMIPGLTMHASSYDPLAKHLGSEKSNGREAVFVVADGQFHLGAVNGPVMSPAQVKTTKMFQIQFTDVRGAPSQKWGQIDQAMSAIQSATGSPRLNVVAHSAGCTDFRMYLDRRSEAAKAQVHVGEAVFIGPATQGTFMGNVGDAVGGVIGVEQAGQELELGSKVVTDLNQRWADQRAQVQGGVTIIGISGAPTPGHGGVSTGDGFMRVQDLALPDAELVVLKGADPTPIAHLTEVAYSGVIGEVEARLAKG